MSAGLSRDVVNGEIERLQGKTFGRLRFSPALEAHFEAATAKARSHRLWVEGLLAILVLNGCLLADLLVVKDRRWQTTVLRTVVVTPMALLVNALMRRNPSRFVREGSVAAAATAICLINLLVEGNKTTASATFGLTCVLIMVLFTAVMMRLRLLYAVIATAVMSTAGLWTFLQSNWLEPSEKVIGTSLMLIGVGITMTAAYSLEREERLGHLFHLRGDMQGEELKALNAELQRLSNVDKLTGLPNRRAFEDAYARFWEEAERTRTPLAAILVDVDHFKVMNDVYGHLYGDKVLHRVAGLLPQGLRGQGDFAARFGGEEFVVLLPNAPLDRAMRVAERIRGLVELAGTPISEQPPGELTIWATISCGVSVCVPGEGVSPDELLRAADSALYGAKADGRNRVGQRAVGSEMVA